MSETFTPFQQEAIDYRGSGVIVSAGAGSGKTRVLTERLMKYIVDDHADIDKFVIITFTQAAAAELKTRISKALREKGMRRQEVLLERAHIGTIHHFCSEILRENAHAVHINPDFRIVSEERADEMKAAALDKIMEARYKTIASDPQFEELVNSVGKGRTDAALVELVLQLHTKMQCHPNPKDWAEHVIRGLATDATDAGQTIWGKEMLRNAALDVEYWCRTLDDLMMETATDEQLSKAYLPSLSVTADGFREYGRNLKLGWDKAVAAPEVEYPRFGTVKSAEDPVLQEKVKTIRNASKKAYEKIRKGICDLSCDLLSDMKTTFPSMEALLQLLLDFDEAYSKDKRRLNYLDYNDLEHMASAFLSTHNISDRFTEVMVDEYQDVSRVQDEIFRCVSDNGKKLFMVGDLKQSIYRFRLADPEIFKEKCEDSAVHSVLLRENFRSGKHIIDSINRVFEKIMTEELGDTDYRKNALIAGLPEEGDKSRDAKVLLIRSKSGEDKLQTEARTIAEKIYELHTEEGVEYGDIAILLRSFGKTGEAFRKALGKWHIPVSAGQGGEFFESPEISAMISILRVMDNPHNDIPLIAALRSPFFGFTADELSEIRVSDRDSDLFDALRIHAKDDKKCAEFLATLERLRSLAPEVSTDVMLRQIINETEAETICSLMSDGEHAMGELMQLVSLGVKFEADGFHGLHRFILYLDKLKEKNADIAAAEREGAVRIMSIHKSKGLEFKVVFVSNLQHQFNNSDTKDAVLIHPELGLGSTVTDKERKIQYPTLAKNAISSRLLREMHSEEMRLLYVALTRAEERLYLSACLEHPEDAVEKAKNTALADAQSLIPWILSADALKVDVLDAPEEKTDDGKNQKEAENEKVSQAILQDFEYEYPYAESVSVPSKVNATELKSYEEPDEESENLIHRGRQRKIATEESPISASERGSATHKVLQLMDFGKDVSAEVKRLQEEKFITPRQAQAADTELIAEFLKSKEGQLVATSDHVRREFEFVLFYNAEDLIGRGGEEKVLLRGVVDCCVEEDDGLSILDYKTDRINSEEDLQRKVNEYQTQLEIYTRSLERIFHKPVKKEILYFLSAKKAVYLK